MHIDYLFESNKAIIIIAILHTAIIFTDKEP